MQESVVSTNVPFLHVNLANIKTYEKHNKKQVKHTNKITNKKTISNKLHCFLQIYDKTQQFTHTYI